MGTIAHASSLTVGETKELFERVFAGKTYLGDLLLFTYDGQFGPYKLAGIITSVVMEGGEILINYNWTAGSPYIRYIKGFGAQLVMDGNVHTSHDLILRVIHVS
jgi:hypothetical protein